MLTNYGAAGRGGRRAAAVLGVAAIAAAVSMPPSMAATSSGQAQLVKFSVQSYATYDRVLIDLSSVPNYTVTGPDVLTSDGSGKGVTLPGSNTYLTVELTPADIEGYSGPKLVTTTSTEVKAVEWVTAFEGYVEMGIGLDHASSYTVTVLSPTELAIDVAH